MEEATRMILSHLNSNKSIWFWGVHPLKAPLQLLYSPLDLKQEVYYEKTNWK